jgi:hypothetical protein
MGSAARSRAFQKDHNDHDFGNKNFEEKRERNKMGSAARSHAFAKDHNDQDFGNKNFEEKRNATFSGSGHDDDDDVVDIAHE